MADAIGQVLSLGVGVALSPVPIIAVVLMLGTPRARVNGPAFLLGWVARAGGRRHDRAARRQRRRRDRGRGTGDLGRRAEARARRAALLVAVTAVARPPARRRRGGDAEVDASDRPLHGRARSIAIATALSASTPRTCC